MKKLILSAAIVPLLSFSAYAADLPNIKGPPAFVPPTPPVFSWTGFYVGADVGGGWVGDRLDYDQVFFPTDYSKSNGSGVIGGGFAGYNWQLPNNIVIGAEANINATSIRTKSTTYYDFGNLLPLTGNVASSLPWQGSLRGRLGYAFGNALIYATGGLALAQIHSSYVDTAPSFSTSFSNTEPGWTVGAGAEYAINSNWTARVQYTYTRYSGASDYISPLVNTYYEGSNTHHINENNVLFGIAYKFGP